MTCVRNCFELLVSAVSLMYQGSGIHVGGSDKHQQSAAKCKPL